MFCSASGLSMGAGRRVIGGVCTVCLLYPYVNTAERIGEARGISWACGGYDYIGDAAVDGPATVRQLVTPPSVSQLAEVESSGAILSR